MAEARKGIETIRRSLFKRRAGTGGNMAEARKGIETQYRQPWRTNKKVVEIWRKPERALKHIFFLTFAFHIGCGNMAEARKGIETSSNTLLIVMGSPCGNMAEARKGIETAGSKLNPRTVFGCVEIWRKPERALKHTRAYWLINSIATSIVAKIWGHR